MNNHEIITKEYKNNKIVPVIDYISYLAKYLYGEYQEYINHIPVRNGKRTSGKTRQKH